MKKLMIATVAGFCAAVTFGIESANVVGYQTKATVSGFNFLVPTFRNVSDGDIDIQSIVLAGDGVTPITDSMQILDEGGATIKTYMWDDGSIAGNGWLDTDTYAIATDAISPGQSVLIDTANAGVNVLFSGSVGTSALVTASRAGFNFVGNASPVPVGIQNITLSGGNVTPITDSMQILDEGGATIKTYMWDDGSIAGNGWLDTDTYTISDDIIDAGEGFLIDTANADVIITVPSAL